MASGAPGHIFAGITEATRVEITVQVGPAETVPAPVVGAARTVRIARNVLLDLDEHEVLSGLWLLNVPPFPADE